MNVTFPYLLILSSYAMECHCVPYLTCRCLSPLSSLYVLWEEGDYTINICVLIFLFPLYRTEQNAFRIVVEEKVFVEINWDTQEFCELDKTVACLKSATVRVFTLWKSAIFSNHSLLFGDPVLSAHCWLCVSNPQQIMNSFRFICAAVPVLW